MGMQRHQGNSGRTNKKFAISARQVNEGALGELEAANAETGSVNGVCTLPVSQCARGDFFAFYSCGTVLCIAQIQAFGAWCSGV